MQGVTGVMRHQALWPRVTLGPKDQLGGSKEVDIFSPGPQGPAAALGEMPGPLVFTPWGIWGQWESFV